MADQEVGNLAGVAAASTGGGTNKSNINGGGVDSTQAGMWDTDMVSIAALRARLAVIDAGYYTAVRLNRMTKNDMLYAVRLADAPASIKQ